MRTPPLFRTSFVAAFFALLPLLSTAQGAPGEVDLSFDPGSGINGAVSALAVQPDGKIIIGGEFTTVNGLARRLIARLHSDGSGDAAFATDIPVDQWGNQQWGSVHALAIQTDGKVLVGHSYGIARLNSDGSLDPSFVADIGTWWEDGTVYSIAVQPDGKVLVGGEFSEVNGTGRSGLARLNANGSLDRGFFPGAVLCCVNSLTLQPDGKVLVVGVFAVDGANRFAVVRLNGDGSLDSTFLADSEVSGPLLMALQPGGEVLVAGYFASGGYGIARLHEDGSLDGGFVPDLPPYLGHPFVTSMIAQADGKVLVSGDFTIVYGAARNLVVRLDADGSVDESFLPGTGSSGNVDAIALQEDGKLLISGAFPTSTGTQRQVLARLEVAGSLDESFQPGAETAGRVTSLVMQPDGKALIGGDFAVVGGLDRSGLARLHADGSLDRTFDPAIKSYATASHVRSVALQPDGKVLATGIFTTQNGDDIQHQTIVRLHSDGSLDSDFHADLATFISTDPCPLRYWFCEESVAAEMALVQPDGRVIISGSALTLAIGEEAYDHYAKPFLARFHPDGSLDNSFQIDAAAGGAFVHRMLLQADGMLLLAGHFEVGGVRRGMVRLEVDGSLDLSFNPEIGIGGSYVNAIAVQADGKVLVGGLAQWVFSRWDNHDHAIARFNADGSLDRSFAPVTGQHDTVQSLVLQPDGKVVVTGLLVSVGDSTAATVVRLNSDGTLDPGFHRPQTTGFVMASALQSDGKVLIGGDFSTVDGEARPRVARLFGYAGLPEDYEAWAAGFGLEGDDAQPDEDPDRDGRRNGVEYVLGGNPIVADGSGGPSVIASGGNLIFTFSRVDRSESAGVTLVVESGSDLITWPTIYHVGAATADSSPGVTISENGTAPDTVTVTIPVGPERERFARLRVTLSP